MDEPGAAGGATTKRRDRRTRNLGPPDGIERRQVAGGRRASDALKMACPFCSGSSSSVVRSRGGIVDDKVGRRRECAYCGARFPTFERVDYGLLERELEGSGVELKDAPVDIPLPTWETATMLLHRLWGQAKEGKYSKPDFIRLQNVLEALQRLS